VFRPCWLHRRTDFSTNVSPPAQRAIGLYKSVSIRKSFTEAPLKRTFSEQHALRHYRMRAVSSYCCQYQPQQRGHTMISMMPLTELCVLLPARRDVCCASAGAIAMAMCLSVFVCVCHSSKRLNKSSWFLARGFLPPILHCVQRKFGYLQKYGYFPMKLCPKLGSSLRISRWHSLSDNEEQ